jgi:hypothetical protein
VLINVLVHYLIFWGGWTIRVDAGDRSSKTRYRSKRAALADLDRQRAAVAELSGPSGGG